MKIKKISRFSERVFQSVLKLLPQLAPDAELPTRQYFKDMLASDNINFFIAELENEQIAGTLTIGTYNIPTGKKVWIEVSSQQTASRKPLFTRNIIASGMLLLSSYAH